MGRETVLEELDRGLMVLTLNRPEQRNAFNSQMYREMCECMQECLARDDVGAVLVTGAPGAFTAGQDLGEMSSASSAPSGSGEPGDHPFAHFMNVLCEFDKPLIAAVNGVGVGLGLTLLLHCDIVYIAKGARLKPPFVTLGLVPEAASSYLLPERVGFQRAAELFFTADWIEADRAVELGIATRLCDPDELLPVAREMALRIAAQPPGALRSTKRLLLATRSEQVRAARRREDEVFAERVGSPENIEAIRAFFEKREPDFSKLRKG